MRSIKIKQNDITDCGAACLASVASFYGLKISLSKIRQYASTDKKGTNILGMVEAAEKLGFTAKGVKGPIDCLSKIPKPAIAHIIVKEVLQHFIVIYKADAKTIAYMDPADGNIHKLKIDEFAKIWTGVLVLLVPNEKFKPLNLNTSIYKKFITLIKPHKTVFFQALFGAIIYSLLGLATSFYVQKIVDYVIIDGNLNLLNLMSIIMLIIIFLRFLIHVMKNTLALNTGQKIDATLILGYYNHLLTLPQRFFDTMRVGEIISRVNDAIKIRHFINNISLDLLVNFFIVLFTFCVMAIFSWKLTIIVAISIPCFVVLFVFFNHLNKKYLRQIMENAAELEAQFVESLNGITTIKKLGAEKLAHLKTEVRFVRLLRTNYVNVKTHIFSSATTELLAATFIVVIFWYGTTKVVHQQITPGTLLSFYALMGYLIPSISLLINANQSVQDALIAADRLFQIMDLDTEENQENKISLQPDMIENIEFRNISFCYGNTTQVFENFSLIIPKGSITAIVGGSGSGKTTLVSLLQNIYQPQSGTIYIGKYNLAHISNNSLRKLVACVPQHIDLFTGTIAENIAFGELEPDLKKIIDICAEIGISEMIENLPNGFMTYVGEHGINLSGGERQKIAIARALYKNPEIIIFDEATSALDSYFEQNIKKLYLNLKKQNKTVIIITHRLNNVLLADQIVLLEKGKLIENGTHHQLMQLKGKYFSLWEHQNVVLDEKEIVSFLE